MKLTISLAIALAAAAPSFGQLAYPPTKTVEASDTYFGRTYADPYRWLENLKDEEVYDWFKAQATLTDSLLRRSRARTPSSGSGRNWTGSSPPPTGT